MSATAPATTEYQASPNRVVSAANEIDYAYREIGNGTPPLVLLQHFRGNLDNWDPALVDALAAGRRGGTFDKAGGGGGGGTHPPPRAAAGRRVVTFDNAGVGGSSGTTPPTVTQMAHDAIAFLDAMGIGRDAGADILGFSIGSFVAQEIALIRPGVVRRLVLASAAPQGAAGMHGWAPEVIGAVGTPRPNPEGYLDV